MSKKKDKKDKKPGKTSSGPKLSKRLKQISDNPLVADVVTAALVAAAAALKDSNKARQIAAQAGDELTALSKKGAEQGNALGQLALDVGRRSLEAVASENRPRKAARPKAKKAAAKPAKAAAKPRKSSAKKK